MRGTMELFDVHVLGFDVSEERATRALMRVFGLNEAASRIFVHSVPRIGKRRVPKDTAERYIRALHAVGAIVECRLTRTSAEPVTGSGGVSLPAPTVSSFPGAAVPHIMQDSFGVMAPVAYSPHMPQIPKAPRVPADLHAIRARKGPDSLAPHWRPADNPEFRVGTSPRAPANDDPDLESPSPDALSFHSEGKPNAAGAGASPAAIIVDEPSSNPMILAKAASGAVFDSDRSLGSSPRPSPSPAVADPEAPWYAQPTHQLLLAAVVVGSVTIAASSGVFDTDASRLTRAFQEAGITPGQYDRASTFLSSQNTSIEGTTKSEVRQLTSALLAAGGVEAWLTGIQEKAGKRTSHHLLIELPEDPAKRREIFQTYAKLAKPGQQGATDHGQRFLSLVF